MDIPVEIAQNYLRRRLSDLEHLERALMKSDYDTCQLIGHRIKGSAQTFGFDDLANLAFSLEKNAKQRDKNSLSADVDDFRTWVNKYIN